MARVTLPSQRRAGLRTRMVLWFTTRGLGRLAGRTAHPDPMVESLRVHAHLALPEYQTSPLFSEVDKLVLAYAEGMSRTPVTVRAGLVERLRDHFTDAQIVELTHLVALENLRGRFNLPLGIEAAGFSRGRVCAVPSPPPGLAAHGSADALPGAQGTQS